MEADGREPHFDAFRNELVGACRNDERRGRGLGFALAQCGLALHQLAHACVRMGQRGQRRLPAKARERIRKGGLDQTQRFYLIGVEVVSNTTMNEYVALRLWASDAVIKPAAARNPKNCS